MASGSVGTVKVQVNPDFEGFRGEVRAALFAMGARDVLLLFSEWLDADQALLKRPWCGGDDRTHEDLVNQFIEEQCARMRPPSDG